MRLLGIVGLIALAASALTQKTYGPFLVDSPKLTEYLLSQVYPAACPDTSTLPAFKDISARGGGVWKINVNRVLASTLANYTSDPLLAQVLADAAKEEGVVKQGTAPEVNWHAADSLKNVQETVYAVAAAGSVDYYHFEFHLNMQGRQPGTKEDYIKAIGALMCITQKDWIKVYLAPTPQNEDL